jgi:hypothetical protein
MKTKFGLLAAVVLFKTGGAFGQVAQSYTINVPNDGSYVLIANQLDRFNNTLNAVLTNPPNGTLLIKWIV